MSNSAIEAVLKDLAPGDELVFQPGIYRNIKLSTARDGSKTQQIRLRAADRGKVVFTGPTRLQIDHKHTVLDGIYFKEVNSFGRLPIIGIRNDHFRITQCVFVVLNENGEQESLGKGIGPANQFIVTEVSLPPSRIYVPQFTRIDHCIFIRGPRVPVVQHMIELTNSLENQNNLKAFPDGFFAENPDMSMEIGKPMYYRVDHCLIAIHTAAFRTSRFGNFAFSGQSDEVDPDIKRLLNIPAHVPNEDITTDLLKKYFRSDNHAAGVFDNNLRLGHRAGDPEDIVSKSSYNVYLNNTFLNNKGHLSLRKGSHETTMHNYFIYEDDYKGPRGYHLLARSVDHVFVKNYFQNGHLGLESGQIRIHQADQALSHKIRYGDEDWTFGENGHATVRRALVAGNSFLFTDPNESSTALGFRKGERRPQMSAKDGTAHRRVSESRFIDNLFVDSNDEADNNGSYFLAYVYEEMIKGLGNVFRGNVYAGRELGQLYRELELAKLENSTLPSKKWSDALELTEEPLAIPGFTRDVASNFPLNPWGVLEQHFRAFPSDVEIRNIPTFPLDLTKLAHKEIAPHKTAFPEAHQMDLEGIGSSWRFERPLRPADVGATWFWRH